MLAIIQDIGSTVAGVLVIGGVAYGLLWLCIFFRGLLGP